MPDWSELLPLSLPVGELLIRGTLTFLGLTLLPRIVGRREAGGLGMTDLFVIVLIADAASSGSRTSRRCGARTSNPTV